MVMAKSRLKSYLKYWREIILFLVLIYILLSLRSCQQYTETIKGLESFNSKIANQLSFESQEVKRWKDSYNQEHQVVRELTINKQAAELVLDSLSQLLKIKSKQIKSTSSTVINLQAGGRPIITPLQKDSNYNIKIGDITFSSLPVTRLNWTDPKGYVQIGGVLFTPNNQDTLWVKGTDTLNITRYWKRKWFLGPKQHYIDVSNSNPYISTNSYKGVQIKESRKNWSVGPFMGIGYGERIEINKPSIVIGVGVQYSLFKF